jgi:hypothetical protein
VTNPLEVLSRVSIYSVRHLPVSFPCCKLLIKYVLDVTMTVYGVACIRECHSLVEIAYIRECHSLVDIAYIREYHSLVEVACIRECHSLVDSS